MVETVIRSPRMHGFPPMTAGLWVMRDRFMSITLKLCGGLSDRDPPCSSWLQSTHPRVSLTFPPQHPCCDL